MRNHLDQAIGAMRRVDFQQGVTESEKFCHCVGKPRHPYMDGDNKNLASLHARATRALELSKESLASCIVTATHIEQGISKLIESHERLEPIKALLQENEKVCKFVVSWRRFCF
jgi:hypothetical protein